MVGANTSTPTAGFAGGFTCATVSGYGLGCPAYLNTTSNATIPASAGLVALAGSAYPTAGDICPSGSYCPSGASAPTPCPAGTQSNTTGATSAAACSPCTAGWLCPSAGESIEHMLLLLRRQD